LAYAKADGRMKRILNKILAITLFFTLFVGSNPAMVEASEPEEIPRVVFENTQNTDPDLHILKTVVSIDSRYEIPPDDEFGFNLQLDGKSANEREYLVFNGDGVRVFNYPLAAGGPSTEDKPGKIPFETDRSGNFTLRTGQRAVFRWIGAGTQYVITEYPTEGYIQTYPVGDLPAVGTMVPNGKGEEFINTYVDIPPPGNEVTTLRVEKNIVFPRRYELPETPDFQFVLELDGKAYSNEPYMIVDVDGRSEEQGSTDENGRFTLKGGESAVFLNVPTNLDYKVTEEGTPDWRAVGETSVQGATQAPITTASFTNANTAFMVTKQMEENVAYEVDFTFVLTDELGKPMTDVEYYLYASDGTRLAEPAGGYKTDAAGKFKLKPNQSAIFVGIAIGTTYNVREEAGEGFVQVVPRTANGYTDKTVTDVLEPLEFVNRQVDRNGTLNVTKEIVVEGEEGTTTSPAFTFVLSKKVAAGEYEVVPNADYSIEVGGNERTYRTNAKGEFTLNRNETAIFKGLELGTTYQVKEVDLPIGYTIALTDVAKEDKLSEQSINFTFTNVYEKKEYNVDLRIHKRDGDKTPLAGAVFELYKGKGVDAPKIGTSEPTGADGIISFKDLELGTYQLIETQSPSGFRLLTSIVEIEIYEREGALAVRVNGKRYTSTDETTGIYMTLEQGENDAVNIVVINHRGFTIPLTGSGGLMLAAMVLLIGTALLYRSMFNKKQKIATKKGRKK